MTSIQEARQVLQNAQDDWDTLSDEEKFGAIDEALHQLGGGR